MGLRERRLLFMFAATLGGCLDWAQLPEALQTVHSTSALRGELEQLVEVLDDARRQATIPWTDQTRLRPTPLHVHGLYRQEEVLVALGVNRNPSWTTSSIPFRTASFLAIFFIVAAPLDKHTDP